MTKNKSTKRALLLSALSLLMCVSMLVGSTFAWFTDSVTSANNIIKTGTLEIGMYWAEGDEDPATFTDWKDASTGAIFNYDKWEPGYSEAKHIKIVNEGSLALNYQMRILANGIVTELADVIDVYYFSTAKKLDRSSFTDANKLGTLSEILNNTYDKALTKTVIGSLEAEKSTVVTLALKMQESAGNEYQNLSIGSDFSVQLIATQKMSEFDSFGNDYDEDSRYPTQDPPSAMVSRLIGDELNINATIGLGGAASPATLTTGYQFEPTEPGDLVAADSAYRWWHADFVVSADKDVKADTLALAGYYSLWCNLANGGNWATIPATEDIKANTPIRLVQAMGNGAITVNYGEICNYGNDGVGFRCGIIDNGATPGTTITVTLRLFEVENANSDSGSHNVETGRTIDIGTFEYVIGGDYRTMDDGTVFFYGDDGYIELYDATNLTASEYTIPEDTDAIADGAFSNNTKTTNVVIPASVKSFGTSTGAFKNSAVESVKFSEGMTTIPDYAFNQAKNLTSFNIPSTVKTIGTRAFRSTAATEVILHEGIESITEAFRDMPNLTTVTVKGNTYISNFSFRDCPNLRTVYLLGEDIVLGGGTTFCNASTNNPNVNNITFYVENDVVASRVNTAMGVGNDFYIFIDGKPVSVVKVANATQLQTALDNATAITIINITANITGNVTAIQKPNVEIVINGNNKKLTGSISINGKSATILTAGLIVRDLIFDATAITTDACINMGIKADTNNTRYVTNLTVENCTFTGNYPTAEPVGIKTYTGGGQNLTIKNCTATNMHSLAQIHNIINVSIEDCTITGAKNGIGIGASRNANISNCEMSVEGYGIRGDANEVDSELTIADCKINGAYIPVVIRKANDAKNSFSLTVNGTNTITGTTNPEDLWCVAATNEYGDFDNNVISKNDLTSVSAKVSITVNDSTLDKNGIFVKK